MENASAFENNDPKRRAAELEVNETQRRRVEEDALRLSAMVESANDAIIGKTTEGIVLT
jgi:hypothetical protein